MFHLLTTMNEDRAVPQSQKRQGHHFMFLLLRWFYCGKKSVTFSRLRWMF